MSLLVPVEEFDNFRLMRVVDAASITPGLRSVVRSLDEREEMEPFLRIILADDAQTPHGPAEIVDIFTHKLTRKGTHGMAAFILKGKSFKTVRHSDVAHQIYRLEKIEGLRFAIFATPGVVLDAAKEHFCATCERMKVNYGFLDATDLARLFVAAGFFCPRDASRISAGRCKCGYRQHQFLNILQQDALKSLLDAHAIGQKTGLVVLPPGSGKTRIAAEDSKRFNAQRILYVAHTQEILDVADSEFQAIFGSKEVGRIERPFRATSTKRVNLATIQLFARHLANFGKDKFDYVVVDEFHHAAAASYRKLIAHLSPQFLLGLTATPFRGDRQDIWKLCGENTIVSYELRGGIETGVLVPYHYYGCFDDLDYTKIQTHGTTYSIQDLERALTVPERDHAIIKKWREMAESRPTLAFCCSIIHADRVAAHFVKAGVSSAAYTSSQSWEERKRRLEQFKNGALKVLAVVDVFNEGADLPFLECLLFLRPTDSKRIFFQQLGRGLRRYPGKAQCLVIDFIGNFKNAYRIVEYQGLLPVEEDDGFVGRRGPKTAKEFLNLPLGCEVHFDDRVINLFASQAFNPANANRHNIGRILIYLYQRLERTRSPAEEG